MVEERVQGPVGPELLDQLHATLERLWLRAPHVRADDRDAFRLAVGEVVGNLLRHGSGAGAVHAEVRLSADHRTLVAVCVDDGDPVELPTLPDDPLAALAALPADATSGRGLALARTAAEVTVTRQAERTTWTVRRALRTA
ncbi:ATP-binding protein [Nitriliruptoraceae bacterium ZYF776]|nr:ATP-binding protein [Profundirhabdus halotolerans]